jgi:hypothetical protein
MKFGYKEILVEPTEAFPLRTKAYRPIIPVSVGYGDKKIGCEVLLDSGADWNLLPSVIGEIIGIDADFPMISQKTQSGFWGMLDFSITLSQGLTRANGI